MLWYFGSFCAVMVLLSTFVGLAGYVFESERLIDVCFPVVGISMLVGWLSLKIDEISREKRRA